MREKEINKLLTEIRDNLAELIEQNRGEDQIPVDFEAVTYRGGKTIATNCDGITFFNIGEACSINGVPLATNGVFSPALKPWEYLINPVIVSYDPAAFNKQIVVIRKYKLGI